MTLGRYTETREAAKDKGMEHKQDRPHGGSSELAARIASCGPITNKLVEAAATCRVMIKTAASDHLMT